MSIQLVSYTTKKDFDMFIYEAKLGLRPRLINFKDGLFSWRDSPEGVDYWCEVSLGLVPLSDALPKLEKYRDEIFGKE